MINSNVLAFWRREYPMIMLFEYGNEILVYDAKPHFAFIISNQEMAVLTDFLSDKPEKEIFQAHAMRPDAVEQLLTKFKELKKAGVFIKGPVAEISPCDRNVINELLEYYDENILLRKFCLQVTENCNFRCKYCKRTIGAEHANNNMSEDHAYQAIRYYFDKYTAFFNRLSPAKKELLLQVVPPLLSFYGGEPFLNFELIKKSTDYFKSLPWEKHSIPVKALGITANTNLSIINDEIIRFLARHKVTLFASLDGPAEEHNRCRVFENGEGTFDVVYANLLKIKQADPAYLKERVYIFGVFTPEHDHKKCVEFTKSLGVFKCRHFPADYTGSFVNNYDAEQRFYKNAVENNLADFKQMVSAIAEIKDTDMDRFHNIFPFVKLNYDNPRGKDRMTIMRSCPMGFDNLMAAANGEYLICHKVNGAMPIGNCATGLDYTKLIDLFQQYNGTINNPECQGCWSVRFCSLCAAARMDQDHFLNPTQDECDLFRLRTFHDFSCFIHLSLEHPEILKKIFDYRNDPKSYVGVIDINEF